MNEASTRDEPTIFDRIGGQPAVDNLIDDFYGRVSADAELAPFFLNISMEKLRNMQRQFFAAALGGDIEYTGRPIAHAHHGLGIKARHLARYVDILRETLAGFQLSQQDHDDIIDRINTYADEILGGGSGLDG